MNKKFAFIAVRKGLKETGEIKAYKIFVVITVEGSFSEVSALKTRYYGVSIAKVNKLTSNYQKSMEYP